MTDARDFTRAAIWTLSPRLRILRTPGQPDVLQQAWHCQGTGKVEWENVPIEHVVPDVPDGAEPEDRAWLAKGNSFP